MWWSQPAPDGPAAYGAVAAWGRIEAQPRGFRAQYAEPVVLAYRGEQPYIRVVDLKAIASEMGLPCVPLEELEAEALKHGQPIPEELRPGEGGLAIPPVAAKWLSGGSVGAFPSSLPTGFAGATPMLPPPPGGSIPPPSPPPERRTPLAVPLIYGVAAMVEVAMGVLWTSVTGYAFAAFFTLLCLITLRRRYRRS